MLESIISKIVLVGILFWQLDFQTLSLWYKCTVNVVVEFSFTFDPDNFTYYNQVTHWFFMLQLVISQITSVMKFFVMGRFCQCRRWRTTRWVVDYIVKATHVMKIIILILVIENFVISVHRVRECRSPY